MVMGMVWHSSISRGSCGAWLLLLLHNLAARGVIVVPIIRLIHVLRLGDVVPGGGVVQLWMKRYRH